MALMFDASRNFKTELTALSDFIQPCAAALWNMRWQVRGYLESQPDASSSELSGRFLAGSGIGSTNFTRFAVEQTWEEQRDLLARQALTVQLTAFETWQFEIPGFTTDARAHIIHCAATTGRWREKTKQWETGINGLPDLLSQFTQDPDLAKAFPPQARKDEPISVTKLDQMLLAFRVFKEARNGLVHGGTGTAKGAAYYSHYEPMAPLQVSRHARKSFLRVPQIFDRQPISVTLEMVTGFSAVLLGIVATVDAVLGVSEGIGAPSLNDRCSRAFLVPLRPGRRGTRESVTRAAMTDANLRYPTPADPSALADWLSARGLLHA